MTKSGLADSPLFVKTNEKKRKQPLRQDTKVPHIHDTMIVAISEAIREVGKEASTYRLTKNEKRIMTDIIYGFKKVQVHISENRII